MSFKFLITIAKTFLSPILSLISSEVKSQLDVSIKNLYTKAKSTPNVFDDLLIGFLAQLLSINVDE